MKKLGRTSNLTLSPAALKLFARKWFLHGFTTSGYGFNGESTPAANRAVRSIILSYFNRLYDTED